MVYLLIYLFISTYSAFAEFIIFRKDKMVSFPFLFFENQEFITYPQKVKSSACLLRDRTRQYCQKPIGGYPEAKGWYLAHGQQTQVGFMPKSIDIFMFILIWMYMYRSVTIFIDISRYRLIFVYICWYLHQLLIRLYIYEYVHIFIDIVV